MLIRYTYQGDANLDGKVNALDFNMLATSFGKTSQVWSNGDFNYDSMVNTSDFTMLASNFGQTLSFSAPPVPGTLVPEPASLAVFNMIVLSLTCARRRNCRRKMAQRE